MNEQTIPEIKQEYSAEPVELTNRRSARTAEIAQKHRPEGDAYYLDRLGDAQQRQLLAEQKAEQAERDRRQLQQEFRATYDRYREDLTARTAFLNRRLFCVEGGESASLLARVAFATEDELSSLLDVAAQWGNAELGRVVFLTAHSRDMPELVHRYFTEVDPEIQPLYVEYRQATGPDTIERQAEDIPAMIPAASADQLAARRTVIS